MNAWTDTLMPHLLLAPVLTPLLTAAVMLLLPERAIATPGLSASMSPGGWLDLMADDTPAMRAQFQGPAPRLEQMYWRGPVLLDYDGRTWTRNRWL